MMLLRVNLREGPVRRLLANLNVKTKSRNRFSRALAIVTQSLEVGETTILIRPAIDPTKRDRMILGVDLRAHEMTSVIPGDNGGGPSTHVGIENDLPPIRSGEHYAGDHVFRKLAWVDRLFFVVVLHVSEQPNVTGILAIWVARQFTSLVPAMKLLVLVLLGDADR